LDVRVSLDVHLQILAHDLLDGRAGTIVLLNASSGELLAMASTPGFDANHLEDDWARLIQDSQAPLINRATQGKYPPGAALGPLLLAQQMTVGVLPDAPENTSIIMAGKRLPCSRTVTDPEWGLAVSAGCPGAAAALAEQIGAERMRDAIHDLGLLDPPQVSLPMAEPDPPTGSSAAEDLFGEASLKTTPLQVALASTALSTGGVIPTPRLVLAVNTPDQGWVVFPQATQSIQGFSPQAATSAAQLLAREGSLFWSCVSLSLRDDEPPVTWFVGGTLPGSMVTPLTAVVLIEEQNPQEAASIGDKILQAALNP